MRQLAALVPVLVSAATALAEFVPGRIYFSAVHHTVSQPDRIYEFDPATGQGGVFAQYGGAATQLQSVSFTPDGSRLRVVDYTSSQLLDFNGSGQPSVAWGPGNGLSGPARAAYSPAGDYWVSQVGNLQPAILRFPHGDGPPEVFAQFPNPPFLIKFGEIAADSAGYVYQSINEKLYRFNSNGTGALLTTLPSTMTSVVIDGQDRLFVWTTSGVFLVDPANPVPHLISPLQSFPDFGSLVLAPGNARLYAIAIDFVYSIDIATGQTVSLGANPAVFPYFGGIGAALYVPEPSALNSTAMLVAAVLLWRRSR